MKLSIKHYPHMERCWLLKREYGEYSQHAHFFTRKDAEQCRRLIDANKYPTNPKYKFAIRRLLTKEEFKQLNRKPLYFRP